MYQWRTQDFSDGRETTPGEGAPTVIFGQFSHKNCIKVKKNRIILGARDARLLDPPMSSLHLLSKVPVE